MVRNLLIVSTHLGKGPKKVKLWSLTATGGGVSLNHTLIAKIYYKKNIYTSSIILNL